MSGQVEDQQKLHDGKWHWEDHLTGYQKRWMKESGGKYVTLGASVAVSMLLVRCSTVMHKLRPR